MCELHKFLYKLNFCGGGASVVLAIFTIRLGDFYQILLSMYDRYSSGTKIEIMYELTSLGSIFSAKKFFGFFFVSYGNKKVGVKNPVSRFDFFYM